MNRDVKVTMRWTARTIVGLALLLGACRDGSAGRADKADSAGVKVDTSAVPAPPAAPAIVFVGTSLTAGLGLDPDDAYPAVVQRMLDSAGLEYTVVNAGQSGETSAGALTRMNWILQQKPAFLVLETGANDGLRGQNPDSLKANIQAIIDRVKQQSPSTRIILAGMEAPPNLGAAYTAKFRQLFPALAKTNNLPLIPFLLAGVGGVDSLNQQDGIHPTEAGARIVATNVFRVLRPELK
jgi:acyl-CoA thioesterase-1